jgi:hypothetical protein
VRGLVAIALAALVCGVAAADGLSHPNTALTEAAHRAATACADYIVIDSRGSGEPGGLSAPGAVFYKAFKAAVARRDPSARVSAIPNGYPAWGSMPTLFSALVKLPQQYHKSVVAGKQWLSNQLGSILTNPNCARSKLLLTGYSQGAQVTGDVYQNTSSPNILGVVLFGDPKFNSADPADRGGGISGLDGALGTRPLYSSAPGKQSVGHVLSYCHDHDAVCQGVSRLGFGGGPHKLCPTRPTVSKQWCDSALIRLI